MQSIKPIIRQLYCITSRLTIRELENYHPLKPFIDEVNNGLDLS